MPAVAEDGTEAVSAAWAKQHGDVVDEVIDTLFVLGEDGAEDLVADFLAVEIKLVKAEAGAMWRLLAMED